MKFGEVSASGAQGSVLAHSHRLGGGKVLKKGQRLSAEDCEALAAAGVTRVTVARLEEGDAGEDEAARRVAGAIAGPHVIAGDAATGRVNLSSDVRGMLVVSRGDVDALNRVDESITVATVVPYRLVQSGDLVATVKIIPFAVERRLVALACDCARARFPLLAVSPLVPKRAGLVMSVLPGMHDEQLARAADNQRLRLSRLGGEVARELRVEHHRDGVARAIAALLDEDLDLVLVLGASAIVDRHDVIPTAIEAVGGVVDHLGMPVDPGNLLLLGHKGRVPIVGVPGCARSLKRSGFDWVLERLASNVAVGPAEITEFGAGGLIVDE
jgi:molybdenum cofactor cytidylyltransferase